MMEMDAQRAHWDSAYRRDPALFGRRHSRTAEHAAARFRQAGVRRVLELGAGQGRDTLFFGLNGFDVVALDYSPSGLSSIRAAAGAAGLGSRINTIVHDVREPLPLPDQSVDAAYAHLLLCMKLSTPEILRLVQEVRRVLVPGGLFIYTARNTTDAHYRFGLDHGDDIYETDGYAVHFFDAGLLDAVSAGWLLDDVRTDEEGALPKRITRVTQIRPPQD